MTYTLSFQVTTSTDPAQLLDLLISMSEELANDCDPAHIIEPNGSTIEGDEWPTADAHCVEESKVG